MNDKIEFGNINTTSSEVGCQEQSVSTISEFYQGMLSFLLLQTSVKSGVPDFCVSQKIAHFLNGILKIAKDNAILRSKIFQKFHKTLQFCICIRIYNLQR